MDLVVNIPTIPKPGETLLGGVFNTYAGGKGANQAVAAARMGAKVSMIGVVGKDSFGTELLECMDAENIDRRFVRIDPDLSTGVALIQVNGSGDNSIAVAQGANFCLTNEDIEIAFDAIGSFDALIMPLETPVEQVYQSAKLASEMGAKVFLNPAPAQFLDKNLLQFVDVLLPNEYEVGILTTDNANPKEADLSSSAKEILSLGVANLLVTLGNQGSTLFNEHWPNGKNIPAFDVQASDTTAAGDCFVGTFAVGMQEGKSMIEAAEFASAAAAISVTRAGAQTSLPYRNEVETFLSERSQQK
ncbi:MAG: ribokinase [Anaerolineaceae bacterium]|nr:ribokinase [Anaerolineaceae bacterium]